MTLRRLLAAFVSLVLVGAITFALTEATAGDVTAVRLGATSTRASRDALRAALGLEGSALHRAAQYAAHLAELDLGRSLVDGRSVRAAIGERLPRSLAVATASLALAWALALLLARARLSIAMALLYAAPLPSIVLALLALGAPYGPGATLFAALCLQPLLLPRVHAHVRRALDDAAGDDALRTLRMAGAMPAQVERAALRLHALRLVTLAALQLPGLLSGVVLVEALLGLPGLGLLAFDALANRDQPLLLGLVLVGAMVTIGCNLVVDLIAPYLDPRLREDA